MIATTRSLCLAALLAAGGAWAQQQATDNPDNPHSTKAKDKQGSDVSPSASQIDQSESRNPHSISSQGDAAKPTGSGDVEAGEQQNPHNPNETWTGGARSSSSGDTSAMGQGRMSGMDHGAMMKNATPQMMLQMLHHSNQHEISMAKMAEKNGTDRVKSYAQTIEQDHQQADKKVEDLAKKKGVTLSDTARNPRMQQHDEMMKQRFSNLKGAQFDRAFADTMANEHRRVIAMARDWRQNCKDQDVCNLIDTLLPRLQQHEQMADQLKAPAAQGRAPENPSR